MNKDIQTIFGTALFGVVSDLAKAKEDGKKLPGVLDDLATLAAKAKASGVDMAKEEAKNQIKKYLPWAGLAIAVGIIIYMNYKKS